MVFPHIFHDDTISQHEEGIVGNGRRHVSSDRRTANGHTSQGCDPAIPFVSFLEQILQDDNRQIDCSQLNELLLMVNKDRVGLPFFRRFFIPPCTVSSGGGRPAASR